MWHEIGQTAGQVFQYLETRSEASSLQIRSHLKITQSLLFLSLGWLSREGRVEILYRDRTFWVQLKK